MILEVYELSANSGDGSLSQEMTVGSSVSSVRALRPHLYISGPPAGSLYMEILSGTTVIATSETIAISAITTSLYFHGYVRFYVDALLAANTNYFFALRSTGYTFSESAFVGWCSDFDLRRYPIASGVTDNPMDTEIWGYKSVTRGTYP